MSDTIYSAIYPITESAEIIKLLWIERYGLPESQANAIIKHKLLPYFATLRDDLFVLVEHPYVDKMYRDSYYNYYSSKLHPYDRDTIRISFFNRKITQDDFFDAERKQAIRNEDCYLGFLTLRPTFPKVIGRSAISPKAKKDADILCCLAKINSTAGFVKYKVLSFPHSSQDNQMITCAETTIWSLLEYFGNKYPEYKPVLPSTIHRILNKYSYKRLMPSEGLTAEQVTFAIRELGFGAMIYSKSKFPAAIFNSLISTYVESGIPIIGVLTDGKIGHAVNIIGRRRIKADQVMATKPLEMQNDEGRPISIIDFSSIDCKYVLIDDNHAPYQLAGLDYPCKEYYSDKKWHDCEIKSIIVPLYPKIYLEANRARHNVWSYLKSKQFGLKTDETQIVKIFLASSRSYKEYLSLNKNLDIRIKQLFLGNSMPKFIWVAEISNTASFEKGLCDGIILQDATEPITMDIAMEDDPKISGHLSLIAGYLNEKYFFQNLGQFKNVRTFAAAFPAYNNNLR
jgi:hypothetical protein